MGSGNVVKLRIIRAFLGEECRIATKYRRDEKKNRGRRRICKERRAANKAKGKKGSKKKGKKGKKGSAKKGKKKAEPQPKKKEKKRNPNGKRTYGKYVEQDKE